MEIQLYVEYLNRAQTTVPLLANSEPIKDLPKNTLLLKEIIVELVQSFGLIIDKDSVKIAVDQTVSIEIGTHLLDVLNNILKSNKFEIEFKNISTKIENNKIIIKQIKPDTLIDPENVKNFIENQRFIDRDSRPVGVEIVLPLKYNDISSSQELILRTIVEEEFKLLGITINKEQMQLRPGSVIISVPVPKNLKSLVDLITKNTNFKKNITTKFNSQKNNLGFNKGSYVKGASNYGSFDTSFTGRFDSTDIGQSDSYYRGMPSRTTSGMPSRTTSGMPSRTTSGMPSRTTSGMPSRTTSGMPSRTTSGIPTDTTTKIPYTQKLTTSLITKKNMLIFLLIVIFIIITTK